MKIPDRGWPYYEGALRRLGEHRPGPKDAPALQFLADLGLVSSGLDTLTDQGQQYFNMAFIRNLTENTMAILRDRLRNYAPARAIIQLLWGVAGASKSTAETVLRSQDFSNGLSERSLGSLLTLMSTVGLIEYSKITGDIRVLEHPLEEATPLPDSTFISPTTPYGNKVWLGRVLEDCTGSIKWLDKHFMPAAFELIWENANANRISQVQILSLRLPDHEGRRQLRQYRDLRNELANRGIQLDWRTIDSKLVRDTHDRWIIGESEAWNIPNVNAVYTGQNSELHRTDSLVELAALFDEYWRHAVEFDASTSTVSDASK